MAASIRLKLERLKVAATAASVAAATLMSAPLSAEDIDIFKAIRGDAPSLNVLVLIDNTANWNSNIKVDEAQGSGSTTKREIEHAVLKRLFGGDRYRDKINVGFMVFSDGNPSGGKLIRSIAPLDEAYSQELGEFFASGEDNRKAGVPGANNAAYALSLEEAVRVFRAEEPRAGAPANNHKINPGQGAIDADGHYTRPDQSACYDHVILIANGEPDSGENSGSTPEQLLGARGGNTDPIRIEPDNFRAIVADEYARYMGATDVRDDQPGRQRLPVHVLDVYSDAKKLSKRELSARSLMRSIAAASGGNYAAATSADAFETEIRDLLDQLVAVDSIFAASSLPVSVNVRGTNLNQVYVGVFRPDANNRTRWQGNLKKYRIGARSGNDIFVADRNGVPALDAVSGFVRQGATSYWTQDSTFWSFAPSGSPPSASDAPDGPVVEKGGVAQGLRQINDSSTPPDGNADSGDYRDLRAVYTCVSCNSGESLSDNLFVAGNPGVTAAALGVDSSEDAQDLVNWVRGEDNHVLELGLDADEDNDGLTNDARASIHGDVLHSQPAIVNYSTSGSAEDTDIAVFYGANDGMLHAVTGGTQGGQELWSFVAEDHFDQLDVLRRNEPGKTYFVDGNVSTYLVDNNRNGIVDTADGDRVLLFSTMRRGGRFLYALDVTDRNDPIFLWKINSDTPGFAELGQTWSTVNVGRVEGVDEPVAIFGAGYDPGADDVPDEGDSVQPASQGRGLFVVNALTGDLVWQAGPSPDNSGTGETVTDNRLTHSMPAAPTAIDRDSDGNFDRLYIPDTGGQVWRVALDAANDAGTVSPASWTLSRIASVGADQKFLNAVDVVPARSTSLESGYDAVLVGAGDRENPFDTAAVNRYYMFKDRGGQDPDIQINQLFDATDNVLQDGGQMEVSAAQILLRESQGWYITLTHAGEKVVTSSTTAAGTTLFNTSSPPPAPVNGVVDCARQQGTARGYAVNYLDGTATMEQDGQAGTDRNDRHVEFAGGGFPPSPVVFVVNIDGETQVGAISGFFDQDLDNINIGERKRVFWSNQRLDQ